MRGARTNLWSVTAGLARAIPARLRFRAFAKEQPAHDSIRRDRRFLCEANAVADQHLQVLRTKGDLMAEQSTETQVLDLPAKMTADSLEASSLDAQTLMLVRIAALVAVDRPPASYLLNLEAAGKVGVEEQIGGVLTGIAPIVGTARVASAAGQMVRALGLAIELGELEAEGAAPLTRPARHE
jgi:4-carboxymuconolactone decarboxylase